MAEIQNEKKVQTTGVTVSAPPKEGYCQYLPRGVSHCANKATKLVTARGMGELRWRFCGLHAQQFTHLMGESNVTITIEDL